ncbi:2342_t:CDS:2 [Funneliformis mosseae]|uniref:2342_t:CDS:1 n=1 Tax=Funneliformis mosseae TaxID=27381 RepID=A0A9N8WHG1_FUNMO|nr:2342_t:CDS:2 [Funneliformis mosseae]
MTAKEVIEFERKLHELLERKPPGISASKIKDLTRIAMTSPKQYKNIVYSVQKFIQRCSVDYKLGALYVLDSISQAAARQKSLVAEKDDINSSGWSGAEYLERFEKVLEEMFSNIMQCPEYDKDKVKRVLDIWISKDAGIYSKEVLQKIKEAHFQQRTTTDDVRSLNGGDHHIGNASYPTTLNPSSLDSSALLATLNNLTQGTLNIPSFLSSQQINSVPIQPNSTIPYNSHATMPATSSSQFTNINLPPSSTSTSNHRPSMPTSTSMNNGYTRSPVSSYNQNVNLKGNKPMHDSFDFDYGDMDEADDIGLMPRVQNNDKNNAEKSLINNVLSVNAVQATTSAASTAPISQFNQDQFNLMANQLFTPSQNAPSISVTQSQIPPQQIQQPSAVPNTTNMPSIPPFQFPPPPQNWVAPGQPPQISSSGMPPLPEHYQPPPPFPLPLWSNQQNVLPPQQWNPNGPPQSNGSQFPPNQTSGQQQNPVPFQGNPPPPGFPAQPSVPISGQPLPAPPGHHVPPPGQPLLGHPMTPQGQPPIITHNVPGSQSGQQLPPPGHQLPPPGHHIPQPPGQTTPNQQQIHPNQPLQTPPQQPPQGGDVCVVYEDQSVGRDFIKVLSRTLYVGSVMEHMSKQYIEDIFAKHGPVSTVTLNYDKNHGFVKLETRAAAARALRGVRMKVRSLKVRWGVGFGPKDCFEFPSGESLIPLNRLTETDRKWLVTSKCGGTGGRPVVGGVVVEEPDIIIGEGFSSGSANKKIGPLFEKSRKFSDASWEGSASPRRRSSYNSESNLPLRNSWSEKVQNAADQKYSPENPLQQPMYTFPLIQPSTNPPTSMDSNRQTPPQQPTDINTNISTNTQQQPQDNYNNNFNQRNEISSPPHSLSGKKRELEQYSADRDDEHYRENKKTRWD